MGGRLVASVFAVICAASAPLGSAHAQAGPTPAERVLAREEFERGVAAIKEGRWEDAYTLFRRAHALTGDPRILLNLGAAQKKTGRLVEALDSYRQLRARAADIGMAEQLPVIDAQITELQGATGRLHLRIEGLERGDQVQLDGAPISAAALGSRVPVDPGTRTVRLVRAGEVLASRTLDVGAGQERTVVLVVPLSHVPPPGPAAGPALVGVAPGGPRASDDEDDSVFSSPWLWLGVGVAALAAGGAITAVVVSQPGEAYNGSTGIVLRGVSW